MNSRQQLRADQATPSRPEWWKGGEWETKRLRQTGWVLLPLRAFLGLTFIYASLQKLSNPDFFNSGSPVSVQHQMQVLAPMSPIGPLVRLSLHAGGFVGLAIALGELAVGLGTLLGLKARLAAAGGAVLALSFFLTVSWNTSPYYYGADIVFLFAWTPFIAIGAAGVLSLDAWIAHHGSAPGRVHGPQPALATRQRERRAILTTGLLAVLVGGSTAWLGRLFGSSHPAAVAVASGRLPQTGTATSPPQSPSHAGAPAGMTRVGAVNVLPVGKAGQFTDPATGNPGWIIRTGQQSFTAFSAVCTHAGCTVNYDPNRDAFVCPCHGGTFSAKTGQVLAGPPPAPLGPIDVQIADGQIYVK